MTTFTFFAAISADGFLAGPNGDMAWAEKYLSQDEDYGFGELMFQSSGVMMGSRTFDFELEALGDQARMLPTFVLTGSPMKYDGIVDPNVHFISGDIGEVAQTIDKMVGGKVFVMGGADVVNQMLNAGLLDRIILFQAPDELGEGLELFEDPLALVLADYALTEETEYSSGLVRREYEVIRK